jgi:hypothetical protein
MDFASSAIAFNIGKMWNQNQRDKNRRVKHCNKRPSLVLILKNVVLLQDLFEYKRFLQCRSLKNNIEDVSFLNSLLFICSQLKTILLLHLQINVQISYYE